MTTRRSSPPTVVLVHQRVSLPWVFDSAHRAGIRIVLVPRPDEEPGRDRLPPAVADILPLDWENDPAGALAALRRRHREAPFDGITTLYDPAVPFAAEAAEALGLPGAGREAALAAQDKRIMRERLAVAGLNVPRFVRLDGGEPEDGLSGLDFPVVVKPAQGYSSLGVMKAGTSEELKTVLDEVRQVCAAKLGTDRGGLIVEEFLDGPEYAVESLAHRGEVKVLSIGYKGEPGGRTSRRASTVPRPRCPGTSKGPSAGR